MKIKQHKDSFLYKNEEKVSNVLSVIISKDSKNYMSQIRYYCSLVDLFDICENSINDLLDQGPIVVNIYPGNRYIIIYYKDEYHYFRSYFYKNIKNHSFNYFQLELTSDYIKDILKYYDENKTT